MSRAYVLLGSNIQPELNVRRALRELRRRFLVVAVSPVFETEPVGDPHQPRFWNLAVELQVEPDPLAIHASLRDIEHCLGRRRDPGRPFGPRSIDLDLILLEGFAGTFGQLILPAPQLHREAFVAVPVAALAPDLVVPELGRPLRDIARLTLGSVEHQPVRLPIEVRP